MTGEAEGPRRRATRSVRRGGLVFLGAALVYGAGTHARVFSAGNDASRWAQVEALVDYGSASIERSRFRGTVDRVRLDGREYSNKPPLLAFAGAALYAPLSAATGWRLGDPATGGRVIWLLTLLLVGLPAAATVARFDGALSREPGLAPGARTLLTLALGAGTLLASFSGTFNNHVPAALLLLLAALAARDGRPLACGAAAGLAAAVDLLPGAGLAPFLLGALASGPRPRRTAARFFAGGSIGAALFVAANLATTGSPLPPKFVAGAVDLSAQAGPSVAGVVLPQGRFYGLEILFGGHGLLAVSPVLLVGLAGLMRALHRPVSGTPRFWRWLAAGILFQVVAHALLAGSYGGWSYGYRYLIPIQPLLLLTAPAVLAARPGRLALAAALPPSILFAALGAFHPWPPAYEQGTAGDPVARLVRNPVGGNAAAWLALHQPDGALARGMGECFVAPDPAVRRRYFRLFFGSKGDLAAMRRFTP